MKASNIDSVFMAIWPLIFFFNKPFIMRLSWFLYIPFWAQRQTGTGVCLFITAGPSTKAVVLLAVFCMAPLPSASTSFTAFPFNKHPSLIHGCQMAATSFVGLLYFIRRSPLRPDQVALTYVVGLSTSTMHALLSGDSHNGRHWRYRGIFFYF